MSDYCMYQDKFLFLKRFFKNPRRVGSISPSSQFLARKMIQKDEIETCKNIIELGAGTGIFSKYIEKYKPENCKFHIFETDPIFRECLKAKFPHLSIYTNAEYIEELIQEKKIDNPELIISGLPFAVFDTFLRNRILDGVYKALTQDGKFITFQYSLDLLKDLKKRYKTVELNYVPLNIPPAVVYRCSKK